MNWEVILPRLVDLLTPSGLLIIIDDEQAPVPWTPELNATIRRFSTNQDFHPYNLIDEISKRVLFEKRGEYRACVVDWNQPVTDYVESLHSRNGFSRDRMTAENAIAFDAAVSALLKPHSVGGRISFGILARLTWGRPKKLPPAPVD